MPITSIYGIFASIFEISMEIFKTKKELTAYLNVLGRKSSSLGLVPTMGALHQGHISLVKRAVAENDCVVTTIFVNPTQFNNPDDLEKYPKTFGKDLSLLQEVSDDIVLFAPKAKDIYDGDMKTGNFSFDGLDTVMEGAFRPNHFDGVATIVKILFKLVKPDRAYFGEKDFQQLQIIKKLVELEEMELEIIPCPIEREANGLARSSRNSRLSKTVRDSAGFIYETLKTAKMKFGTENANSITDWVGEQFVENELFDLEYFQIADIDNLLPIKNKIQHKKYRAFIAVYADEVRLIDNIALNY